MIVFSYADYCRAIREGHIGPPPSFRSFIQPDRARQSAMETEQEETGNTVDRSLRELRKRLCKQHYSKIRTAQRDALDYSQRAFPAYKFLLPEVIASDWLATVGWHKFNRDHCLHQPLTAYVVSKLFSNRGPGALSFRYRDSGDPKPLFECVLQATLEQLGHGYLGDYLLRTGFSRHANGMSWLSGRGVYRTSWRNALQATAWLASIFHDMGYPWQYLNVLHGRLNASGFQTPVPAQAADVILDRYGERLLFCPLNGYRLLDRSTPVTWPDRLRDLVQEALQKTHGFPGAIGFLYLNDLLNVFPRDKPHPVRGFCLEWAAMAMLMHDMMKIYFGNYKKTGQIANPQMRLSFEKDPLSSVLTLADLIQEFERPSVRFSQSNDSFKTKYFPPCKKTSVEWDEISHVLTIRYYMKSQSDAARKRVFLRSERVDYFDNNHGFIDLAVLGIERVEMHACH